MQHGDVEIEKFKLDDLGHVLTHRHGVVHHHAPLQPAARPPGDALLHAHCEAIVLVFLAWFVLGVHLAMLGSLQEVH